MKRPGMDGKSVQELIQVHLVTDGPDTKGWVHTHGLCEHGLPELEIRGIPLFLGASAARILNIVSEYMLTTDKKVSLGEVIQVDQNTLVSLEKLEPLRGHKGHYEDERWALVDACEGYCAVCKSMPVYKLNL